MDRSTPNRPVTNPLKAPADDSLDQQTLRTLVFDTIIARLKALNIPTYHLDQHKLSFALPTSPSDDWLLLLDKPTLLSDDAFAKIIACTETTGIMRDCPKGHTVYYIRSWKMQIKQLRAILDLWKQRGKDYPEAAVWEAMIEDIIDDTIFVYIRYLGKTDTTSGQERHPLCPSVMSRVKIFHVDAFELKPSVYGTAYKAKPSVEDADLRERVLIALVGQASSLNRQSGGTLVAYQPSDSDIVCFKQLGTATFAKLAEKAIHQQPSSTLRKRVTAWMDDTLHFAAQHPAKLGLGKKSPLNHQHRKKWIDQALPTRLLGYTLMVTMGDDMPLLALDNPLNFWFQKARSAQMMKDFLSRLMAYEQDRSDWHPLRLDPLVEAGVLPFIDHAYWPKMDSLPIESIALTRSYLEAAEPLLLLVLGQKNNKFVRSNFTSTSHPSIPNLLSELRNFTIQYYTDPGEITRAKFKLPVAASPIDPKHAFIQMPSFHPGSDRYGSGSTALRRVIDLNFWKICLAMEVTLDVLYRFENDAATLRPSRLKLCRLVLDHVERRWKDSGAEAVFQQAKRDLDAEKRGQNDGNNRWVSDKTRAFTRSVNGHTVNITSIGKITFYWKNNAGQNQQVSLFGRKDTVPGTGKATTAKVLFTEQGIDIQDHSGNSMPHPWYGKSYTNPTFPTSVLRVKGDKDIKSVIMLWEHETGLTLSG
ncbi:hypothetical protein KCU98_g8699, partial [Aureobasidium melanogenum]